MSALKDYRDGLHTPSPSPDTSTPFFGRPLVYVTGAPNPVKHPGAVVIGPKGLDVIGERTFKVAHCDLLCSRVPGGPEAWLENLCVQFDHARGLGYDYVELKNSDHFGIDDVVKAINVAADYRLKVIAKNPARVGPRESNAAITYVAHPNVFGMIVERNAGSPEQMNVLRAKAGKGGAIPVWFIFDGSLGANQCAQQILAGKFRGMGVTYSAKPGAYENSVALLTPLP